MKTTSKRKTQERKGGGKKTYKKTCKRGGTKQNPTFEISLKSERTTEGESPVRPFQERKFVLVKIEDSQLRKEGRLQARNGGRKKRKKG